MQYKSITTLRKEQERRLKRLGLLSVMLKVIAIVGILWLMTGCVTKSENVGITNNCLDTAEYYGDYIECAIQLDALQK